jgi:hypothetical protein
VTAAAGDGLGVTAGGGVPLGEADGVGVADRCAVGDGDVVTGAGEGEGDDCTAAGTLGATAVAGGRTSR